MARTLPTQSTERVSRKGQRPRPPAAHTPKPASAAPLRNGTLHYPSELKHPREPLFSSFVAPVATHIAVIRSDSVKTAMTARLNRERDGLLKDMTRAREENCSPLRHPNTAAAVEPPEVVDTRPLTARDMMSTLTIGSPRLWGFATEASLGGTMGNTMATNTTMLVAPTSPGAAGVQQVADSPTDADFTIAKLLPTAPTLTAFGSPRLPDLFTRTGRRPPVAQRHLVFKIEDAGASPMSPAKSAHRRSEWDVQSQPFEDPEIEGDAFLRVSSGQSHEPGMPSRLMSRHHSIQALKPMSRSPSYVAIKTA
jgi:hypothetical protein